jgi:DnaJ like chaperone protein
MELSISKEILEHIYSVYESLNAQFEERKSKRPMRRESKMNIYRKILGITESADEQAIKKAYRKLAKMYHPDKLANATEAQQKMAEDKFVEIQNAYEFLLKECRLKSV